ncbi:hypothetical protein EB001_10825 [bacterium]|nr:hypothetical protein [bacterium]
MSTFLDTFPKIQYDIVKAKQSNYQIITNILFRIGIIKDILSNISAYYNLSIIDGETPEIIASKIYGNPEAYWMILYANDIHDPQYDWPMTSTVFKKYLESKYGTVNAAQTGIHHHEKVIIKTESLSGIKSEWRSVINYDKLTENDMGIPYDYYLSPAFANSVVDIVSVNGQTVTQVTTVEAISYYDYEERENEKKRDIKIIKVEYYRQILTELAKLTGDRLNPYLRNLIG